MRVPTSSPHFVVAGARYVDDGAKWLRVTHRRDGPDHETHTGELFHPDSVCVGGLLRSAGVVAKAPDLAACSKECEPLSDPYD